MQDGATVSTKSNKKLGDFSGLAANYSKYRPSYCPSILSALKGFADIEWSNAKVADVGAGTGIWTRILATQNPNYIAAVEPNADMRKHGIEDSMNTSIQWFEGSAEDTNLPTNNFDILTMASSFHWADFSQAMSEFGRVLKPGGTFCSLWNPRNIESNPLLVEIESKLYELAPHIVRKSSGNSAFTDALHNNLKSHPQVKEVIYLEGRHSVVQSLEEYLGVWWSVNDIRAQAGEETFYQFMDYVENRIAKEPHIETEYKTRAWAAKFV